LVAGGLDQNEMFLCAGHGWGPFSRARGSERFAHQGEVCNNHNLVLVRFTQKKHFCPFADRFSCVSLRQRLATSQFWTLSLSSPPTNVIAAVGRSKPTRVVGLRPNTRGS